MNNQKDLKVLSLFSGCGGMDLGMEGGFEVHKDCVNLKINKDWKIKKTNKDWVQLPPTRFQTVFANDIRPGAKVVWNNFFSKEGHAFHVESIVERVKKYQAGQKDLFPDSVDVVTGGFPCQDFSVAGKRRGFTSLKNHDGEVLEAPSEESRGKLYMWMREVVSITRPKIFIAENVKGLVSLGGVKEIIENDFSKIGDGGYTVLPAKVLHAADFGVPQSRERVFFIGIRKNALKKNTELNPDSFFPEVTHSPDLKSKMKLLPYVTLEKIFQDLDEPNQCLDQDQKVFSRAKWYGKHCQGNREIDLKKIGPTIRSEHHGNIEFRRLAKSHGGAILTELKSGLKERRLTVRECARIQTFPDSYKFLSDKKNSGVSASEAYKLIGNAVPPLLAYHIAKKIESVWDDLFL